MVKKPKYIGKLGREYFKTISTMLTTAFGLVAALAWNDTIKEIIDSYFPRGSGIISHLIYALLITIIVVIFTAYFAKVAQYFQETEEKE